MGTWGGETNTDKDLPKYADWYLTGKLNLGELITREYKLEYINQAFDDLENGKIARVLVDMKIKRENI